MAKIYALSNRLYLKENLVKIGLTTDLDRRKDQLESGQPYSLETIATIEVPERYTRDVERFLHKALDPLRHDKGEWFRIPRNRVESLFEKAGDLIKVGHVIDGLEQTLAIFDEIFQARSEAPSSQKDIEGSEGKQRKRGGKVDYRDYVPDGTTLRYGMTDQYCERRGDVLVTDDGQNFDYPSAAAGHIARQRGGKGKVDGWLQLRIKKGDQWVKLRSLREDLPEDVRLK